MKTKNIYNVVNLFCYRWSMKKVGLASLALCLMSCGDNIIDTEISTSRSNKEFTLSLSISDEIVRLDDSIKLTTIIERKVHKDSIVGTDPTKLIMDAVGGTIDGHSFTTYATSISVELDKEQGSVFETLAFFLPTTSGSGKKENGHISASFGGINLSMPITIVDPR